MASYANGVYSDWGYSAIVRYDCPLPGSLNVVPNPIKVQSENESETLQVYITCRHWDGSSFGQGTIDMIGKHRDGSATLSWTIGNDVQICTAYGTQMHGTNPGDKIYAGANTTVDPCEGKLYVSVNNYGWPEIGAISGSADVIITIRPTEEFEYTGDVITTPPPGFEEFIGFETQ